MNTNDVVVLEEGVCTDEPIGLLDVQPNTDFRQGLDENRSVPVGVSNTRLENQNVVEKRENPVEVKAKIEESQKPNTENTKDEEIRKSEERESSKPCHSTTSMMEDLPHVVRKNITSFDLQNNKSRKTFVRLTDSEYIRRFELMQKLNPPEGLGDVVAQVTLGADIKPHACKKRNPQKIHTASKNKPTRHNQ